MGSSNSVSTMAKDESDAAKKVQEEDDDEPDEW